MLTIMLYVFGLVIMLCWGVVGWFACMIYYKIDPSDLYLYKAIYGTI